MMCRHGSNHAADMQSCVKIKKETRVIYGNIDVVES